MFAELFHGDVSSLRIACFAYAAEGGCWNLTRALKLVGVDAVNCITALNYLDSPYWFDVSSVDGQVGFQTWLDQGGVDVVVVNKYRLWAKPYPIRIPWEKARLRLIWHRGSVYRRDYAKMNIEDKVAGVVRVASTLDLLQFGKPDLHWFSPPLPIDEYAGFKQRWRGRQIRLFHSPTIREMKGTKEFIECIDELKHQSSDYDNLQLVLVEKVSHRRCMEIRGTCDVAFDQAHNLCYGNSGLEACCMKMPVIVNVHPTVYDELKERGIEPWFLDPGFNDKPKLKDCIKELYNDASLRRKMGWKGYNYVKEWHDLPICGERFLSIINPYLTGDLPLPKATLGGTKRKLR